MLKKIAPGDAPSQKLSSANKLIFFTEKAITELKSLGKIFKEKRCHLMGCNDSSGKVFTPKSENEHLSSEHQ